MYLRKIEMKGFKSFADKTKVAFESGITCIVGPNGSGKSNITDAIRWVLGEQKVKSLRSQKMEDVIFNGTKTRSAVGLAEVALTFDNSEGYFPLDFKEVVVARKVYRSGESEYRLNNTSCRLKDLRDLFMDTGIGTDGYSIIGQGQIDELLSKNKDDRRRLFEEAAGISKYKARKKETERKLDRTEENLIRVEDILQELKKRRDPLKKQAEKARVYLEVADKLKRKYLQRVSIDYERLEKEEAALKEASSQLHKELTSFQRDRDALKEEVEKREKNHNALEDEIDRTNERIRDLEELLSDLKTTVRLGEEKVAEINRRFTQMETELSRSEKKHRESKSEWAQLVKELEEIDAHLASQRQVLETFQSRMDEGEKARASQRQMLGTEEGQLENLKANQRRLENEMVVLEELMQAKRSRSLEQERFLENQKDREKQLLKKKASLLEEQETIDERVKEKVSGYEEKKRDLKEREETFENMRRAWQSLSVDLDKKRQQKKLLTGYEESYEGYDYTVKRLMQELSKKPEELALTLGVVADLFEVPKDLNLAIETALGRSLQYVVSPKLSDVKVLISLLKEKKLGRTSFLPLDDLRDRSVSLPTSLQGERGFLGRGVDLVSFAPKYQQLFGYLLGGILVVEDFDTAERLIKRHRVRQRIVTLDGDLVNPGGTVTGGTRAKNSGSGILDRKNRIKELTQSLKNQKRKTEEMEKDLTLAKASLDKSRNDLEKAREDLDQERYRLKIMGSEIDQLRLLLQETSDSVRKDAEEAHGLKSDLLQKQKEWEEKSALVKTLKEDIQEKEETLKALRQALSDHEKDKEELRTQINETKVNLARLDESRQIKRAALKKREEALQEEEGLLQRRFLDHEALIKEKADLLRQRDQSQDRIEEKLLEKETLEKAREQALEKRRSERDALDKTRQKERALLDTFEATKEKEHAVALELARAESACNHLKDDVFEKYQLSIASAHESYRDLDLSYIEETEEALRKTIKKLGPVNIEAIEEFELVEERFVFLTEQMEDLKKARRELMGVIRTLEKQMKSQFISHFERIKEAFSETFIELFNGGSCDLELIDPQEVLESDIAIIAQPPGKKLGSIDLLSGGEKALTAISLLFAILKIKPAPFCVLDEIEAALDDVNVYRFADFLKRLIHRSQFLVITHRKGTMEIADALYGITMEEYGVSKVVSLKLEDHKGEDYAEGMV